MPLASSRHNFSSMHFHLFVLSLDVCWTQFTIGSSCNSWVDISTLLIFEIVLKLLMDMHGVLKASAQNLVYPTTDSPHPFHQRLKLLVRTVSGNPYKTHWDFTRHCWSHHAVLQVTKNSPERVLSLAFDVSFRFSTLIPGRVAAWVVGYVLRYAKYARFLIINCLILTSINTTDFRLSPDFWQSIISSSVLSQSSINAVEAESWKFKLFFLCFWEAIRGFLILDNILKQLPSFVKNDTVLDPKAQIYIP